MLCREWKPVLERARRARQLPMARFLWSGVMGGESLPLLFATQFPLIWGSTTKRYGNTGHFHHLKVSEFSGIKMMQHPTIAANDSHGSRSGYHSEREMTAITFHKDFGKATETVVTPEMLASV